MRATAGDHTPEGCRAGDCLCPATWDGLTAEDLEDDEELEAEVTRVLAAVRAARAFWKRIDDERRDREAAGTATSGALKLRVTKRRKLTVSAAEPKAPRTAVPKVARAKPKTPALPPSADEDGRIHGLLSIEQEALEAVGSSRGR